ncbi:MAG: GNAT family N-acetyltransferase [Polyangiaceae bacterium]
MWKSLKDASRGMLPFRRKTVLSVDLRTILRHEANVVFSRARSPHLEQIATLCGSSNVELAAMHRRLERGDWCIQGHVRGELAFVGWLMFGEMEVGELIAFTSPDTAYTYKLFTAPDFRRRNIAAAFYSYLAATLAPRATMRLFATVLDDDPASRKLLDRCGFTLLGSMWDIRGLGSFTSSAVSAALREEPRVSVLRVVRPQSFPASRDRFA